MRVLTSITHSRRVVTILFHDSCRSARLLCPTVRSLLACCLCRVSSLPVDQAPPVLVALVGETGQSARVRTQKGSETLVGTIGQFKLRLGLFKRFIRLRE